MHHRSLYLQPLQPSRLDISLQTHMPTTNSAGRRLAAQWEVVVYPPTWPMLPLCSQMMVSQLICSDHVAFRHVLCMLLQAERMEAPPPSEAVPQTGARHDVDQGQDHAESLQASFCNTSRVCSHHKQLSQQGAMFPALLRSPRDARALQLGVIRQWAAAYPSEPMMHLRPVSHAQTPAPAC